MDHKTFKAGDIVKNSNTGEFMRVVAMNGVKVTVIRQVPSEYPILASVLEAASPEEALKADAELPHTSQPDAVAGKHITRTDRMAQWDSRLEAKTAGSAKTFNEFWDELTDIAGYLPGYSWDFRRKGSKQDFPVLQVYNPINKAWNQMLYILQWGKKVKMEISKDYIPPRFAHLFLAKKSMYGNCSPMELPIAEFIAKKGEYLACLRYIYAMNPGPVKPR